MLCELICQYKKGSKISFVNSFVKRSLVNKHLLSKSLGPFISLNWGYNLEYRFLAFFLVFGVFSLVSPGFPYLGSCPSPGLGKRLPPEFFLPDQSIRINRKSFIFRNMCLLSNNPHGAQKYRYLLIKDNKKMTWRSEIYMV